MQETPQSAETAVENASRNYSALLQGKIDLIDRLNERLHLQKNQNQGPDQNFLLVMQGLSQAEIGRGFMNADAEIRFKTSLVKAGFNFNSRQTQALNKKCLELVFADRKLKPTDKKIFNAVKDGNVIEVYDSQNLTLINANLEFEKICPYPKITTWFYPYHVLYKRNKKFQALIDLEAAKAMGSQTTRSEIPKHLVRAANKYFQYTLQWYGSASDENDNPSAIIAISTIKGLDPSSHLIDLS